MFPFCRYRLDYRVSLIACWCGTPSRELQPQNWCSTHSWERQAPQPALCPSYAISATVHAEREPDLSAAEQWRLTAKPRDGGMWKGCFLSQLYLWDWMSRIYIRRGYCRRPFLIVWWEIKGCEILPCRPQPASPFMVCLKLKIVESHNQTRMLLWQSTSHVIQWKPVSSLACSKSRNSASIDLVWMMVIQFRCWETAVSVHREY